MHYIPKSHLDGLVKHNPIGKVIRNRTGKVGQSLSCDIELNEFVPVPMKKGDVLVHDQLCIHYSSTNKTPNKRIALTCMIEIKLVYL